jgi:hypothetical protein
MSKKPYPTLIVLIALGLLSILFTQGCSTPGSDQVNPTLTALSQSISSTATAAGLDGESENTLATAESEATQVSEDVQATETSQNVGRDEGQLATATVAAPIIAELPSYGLDATSGHVGWMHDPLTLDVTGYQQVAYGNDYMNVIAADFVLAADVIMDTQYGTSGCGFMFRSDGDKNKPNQYMVVLSRFANGRGLFTAVADGELANIKDFYPKDEDKSFDWQNGATNRLSIVARGNIIEIYTNLVKIGEIDTTAPPKKLVKPPKPQMPTDELDLKAMNQYKDLLNEYNKIIEQNDMEYQTAAMNFETKPTDFKEGFLAMIALSQSGHTACTFENAWLWQLEP